MTDTSDEIAESADHVAQVAREHAFAGEAANVVTAEVLNALEDSDLLRMALPRRYDGPGVDPLTSAKALMAVAEADAAAAWYPSVSSANSFFSLYLPERGAREVFGSRRAVGSAGAPAGDAEQAGTGIRVRSGRWKWGSLGAVAAWMGVTTFVSGRCLLGFVPAAEYVVEDGWSAHGMRATASGDFTVRPGTVVPAHRLVDMTLPKAPVDDEPLARFPLTAYVSYGFAAVALGNAAGALADLTEMAPNRTPSGSAVSLAHSEFVQVELARAEARLHSARAFFLESVAELWESARAGAEPGQLTRARARLAMSHAVAESAAVIDAVYPHGGGSVVNTCNSLQKRWRDAHVITQQAQVSIRSYGLYGKILLGAPLEPAAWRYAF